MLYSIVYSIKYRYLQRRFAVALAFAVMFMLSHSVMYRYQWRSKRGGPPWAAKLGWYLKFGPGKMQRKQTGGGKRGGNFFASLRRKKRVMSKKKSSRKIWENRVKKTSSRRSKGWKVGKHPQIEVPQMGKFEHILDNAGSGCGGKSGGGEGGGRYPSYATDRYFNRLD